MRNYKFIVYVYLFFAAFFAYDAVKTYVEGGDFWIRIIFAVLALGLFFFRLRFIKKMQK